MVYYQVKESSDQTPVFKKISSGHWMQARILIANELYTQNELMKMVDKYNLSTEFLLKHFQPYSTAKYKTFWSFGCRFPVKESTEKGGVKMDKQNIDLALLLSSKADPILISVLKSENLDLSEAKFITKSDDKR